MYWEARMRIHQQKHTLAEPCLFYVLFITNHITDVLSDLSWTAVLARAEPCVEIYILYIYTVVWKSVGPLPDFLFFCMFVTL